MRILPQLTDAFDSYYLHYCCEHDGDCRMIASSFLSKGALALVCVVMMFTAFIR